MLLNLLVRFEKIFMCREEGEGNWDAQSNWSVLRLRPQGGQRGDGSRAQACYTATIPSVSTPHSIKHRHSFQVGKIKLMWKCLKTLILSQDHQISINHGCKKTFIPPAMIGWLEMCVKWQMNRCIYIIKMSLGVWVSCYNLILLWDTHILSWQLDKVFKPTPATSI